MPRNGSGGYSLPVNSWNPAQNGVSATPTDYQAVIDDLSSAMGQSVSKDGQTPMTGNLQMGGNQITGMDPALNPGDAIAQGQAGASLDGLTLTDPLVMTAARVNEAHGADIASAATLNLDAADGNLVDVTGTTTVTAITLADGHEAVTRFTGALLLTNGASLVLLGGANITTAAGDFAIWRGYTGGVVRMVGYSRASGAPLSQISQMSQVSGSVAANALTVGYAGGVLDFRSVTIGSGALTQLSIGALSLVISSGSTLGTSNGAPARLWLAVLNTGGSPAVPKLAIINTQLGGGQIYPINESGLITTVAEGGVGAADSAGVWYSDAIYSNVPFRLVGYVEATEATAGTWATAPSVIQGMGIGVRKPGEEIQHLFQPVSAQSNNATNFTNNNSIRTTADGSEYMSKAITPTSVINTLRIKSKGNWSNSAATAPFFVGIFQDATANALKSSLDTSAPGGANQSHTQGVEHQMQAGTVSSTTFKIRAGSNTGTTTFNGSAGAALGGGVLDSFLSIKEIMA